VNAAAQAARDRLESCAIRLFEFPCLAYAPCGVCGERIDGGARDLVDFD
jgi:hypothetical protein